MERILEVSSQLRRVWGLVLPMESSLGEEHVEEYDKKGQMEQLVEYVCKGSKETKKKNKKDKRKKNE